MKKEIKVYLEPRDIRSLQAKAKELGLVGRGSLSAYIGKVAQQPIVFLSPGVRVVLESKS